MIPEPAALRDDGQPAVLGDGCAVVCDAGAWQVGRGLRSWLEAATGWDVTLSDTDTDTDTDPGLAENVIRLRLDEERGERRDGEHPAGEGYRLQAGPAGVTISASDPAGVFYGVQSLRLLLPPELLRAAPPSGHAGSVTVPGTDITDRPALGWRGVHLDVARHFMPKHWLLRLIDLLALHKLNVLHLHLTDDQGWRVEIERYPRLTEVGAWRGESPVGRGRDGRHDGVPHGGYYTKDDLREIVAYAARQFVTVVPEIDMPGHMQAAIAAYPELGNGGAHDFPRVEVRRDWGISRNVLNLADETIQFCRDVVDEVLDIFPARYVHLGGDECPTAEWERSPLAQQRMADLGLTDERQLQGWFTARMAEHVAARGRTLVLWDEALESGAPPEAVIMPWRSEMAGLNAASRGHRVVMAPQYWTYFDWAQASGDDEPIGMGGPTSLRRVHAFDPVPAGLDPAGRERVIGAQCQLWTEFVPTPQRAEYQYFPRLCAFAEVAWSGKDQTADPEHAAGAYADFERRLAGHLTRLDVLGVNYRPLAGPTPAQARPADAVG